MVKGNFLKITIGFVFLFNCHKSQAQTCVDDYFAITYTSPNLTFYHSVLTSSNEIICVGNVDYPASGVSNSQGWLAKLTANGTVLWSKRYVFPKYNYTIFRDVVQSSDDSYWVVGLAEDSSHTANTLNRITGILAHIDKYGNLTQSYAFDDSFRPNELTSFEGISKMADGDFIIRGSISLVGSVFIKAMMLRIDDKGNVKWVTRIYSPDNSFGIGQSSDVLQQNDKIIFGTYVIKRDVSTFQILKQGYFLSGLDYATGHLAWNKTYEYFIGQIGTLVSTFGIVHISSLGDGRLSFQTSFSDSAQYQQAPYTDRSVNMVTDASGNLLKAVGYYNMRPGCATSDAHDEADGSQVLLMDDGNNPLLIKADKEGVVQWQVGYHNISGNPLPGQLMSAPSGGYYLFTSDRYDQGMIHVLKTGAGADIACAKDTVQIVTEDVTGSLKIYDSDIYGTSSFNDTTYRMPGQIVYKNDYSISANIDCRKPCCTNVTDTAVSITLCDVNSYTLPNSDVIQESGIYYTLFKTMKGCDSVSFLPVTFLKKPANILSGDECLENKDSIVLKAPDGFSSYNWMNTVTTNSTYTVRQPGVYWVEVTNTCGNKRDSVTVFEKCDFEIFMPNAFTPNNDGLNDNFGVSPYNKNRFVKLQVFNRYGKIIFETSDVNKRWDGSYKKSPQPVGVYIYKLQMENLIGKKILKSGIITLVR